MCVCVCVCVCVWLRKQRSRVYERERERESVRMCMWLRMCAWARVEMRCCVTNAGFRNNRTESGALPMQCEVSGVRRGRYPHSSPSAGGCVCKYVVCSQKKRKREEARKKGTKGDCIRMKREEREEWRADRRGIGAGKGVDKKREGKGREEKRVVVVVVW